MSRRAWTEIELAVLREHYPTSLTADIARAIGRSHLAVYQQARALGLTKTAAFYASPEAKRLDGSTGEDCRFRPGHTPWNKGKTGVTTGGQATRFQPGRQPHEAHNYRPIGSTKINYGNLERKITDDLSVYPAKRWRPVHRLVWEAAHGPVPDGHVVVFRTGMHTIVEDEITLDRLELITRRELMARNTVHNLPKAVAEVVLLRGALKRKINRLEKNHERHD